jgi:hypothetical protein
VTCERHKTVQKPRAITLRSFVPRVAFEHQSILHRLGDHAFGIWARIFSITGYYGLFDLGIRSSIVRYVSKARATGDLNYASKVISTSLLAYTCIGIFTFVITLFCAC